MPVLPPDRTPVIVGIGEITDRPVDLSEAKEPVALMEEAVRRAAADAADSRAAQLIGSLDSLDIVAQYSWPYADTTALLSDRLGHRPHRCEYGTVGGESPVRFIHEAALRIARGETSVAAIVGAEASHSVAAAAKTDTTLPWAPRDTNARLLRGKDWCHSIALSHGMTQPVQIYPLYENAALAAWSQTPAQAHDESAELWSRFSAVAAENPYAWLQRRLSPAAIAMIGPGNRPIAWPYPKHMVANPFVNQGAAVILMSLERARELGLAEHRPERPHIYVWSGASASESADYLQRDQYTHSTAQDAVLDAAVDQAGGDANRFAAIELYSCFPIVPKMARRRLGIGVDSSMTCTGGLSFFGAPLNNYMTHAAAGLVRQLRTQPGKLALLYGQGGFVTKHHALVLAASAPDEDQLTLEYCVQGEAERMRGETPPLISTYAGTASIETFTVLYGRSGAPDFGTVIARTSANARLMARVRPDDAASLALLTHIERTPIGHPGIVSAGDDGLLTWKAA